MTADGVEVSEETLPDAPTVADALGEVDGLRERDEELAAEIAPARHAARLTVTPKLDDLDDDDVAEVAGLFPVWVPDGTHYPKGHVVAFGGTLAKAALPHDSQPDWAPDRATNLWRLFRTPPESGYPQWLPWDGHNESLWQVDTDEDPQRVEHDGRNWRSTAANNHWRPGEHGWELLEEQP